MNGGMRGNDEGGGVQSCSWGTNHLSINSKDLSSYFHSVWWLLVVSADVGPS